MEKNNIIISPKTKILQLIETFPHLEDLLIGYVPAFNKLKNPVLRRTIARVATLQQVAAIGNMKVEDLINLLRKEVGQDTISLTEETNYTTEKPDWFDEKQIVQSLDIREMLNRGEQPVNQVISELHRLEADRIYEVIAPFIPAPLIDKASSMNVSHWVKKENSELFFVYFRKK
jgi:hypothetical protein